MKENFRVVFSLTLTKTQVISTLIVRDNRVFVCKYFALYPGNKERRSIFQISYVQSTAQIKEDPVDWLQILSNNQSSCGHKDISPKIPDVHKKMAAAAKITAYQQACVYDLLINLHQFGAALTCLKIRSFCSMMWCIIDVLLQFRLLVFAIAISLSLQLLLYTLFSFLFILAQQLTIVSISSALLLSMSNVLLFLSFLQPQWCM